MGDLDRVFWCSVPFVGPVAVVGVVAPDSGWFEWFTEPPEDARRVEGLRGPTGGRVGDATGAMEDEEAEGPEFDPTADAVPLNVEVEPDMEGWM